jgi:protein-tyrosine phosphatase
VREGADPRSRIAAKRRGYDLSSHRARRVEPSDFVNFDYVLAMDRDNMRHLEMLAESLPEGMAKAKPQMLLEFAPAVQWEEVPDPYAKGPEGFEIVLDMLESSCDALLEHIRANDLVP